MTAYSTRVSKPLNHQDFEERASVLFRGLLNDPNLKRFGRSGQSQDGIDLLGRRNNDPKKIVGVQCKLKGENEKLTESEVRAHVTMALALRPKLTEYILVTTAPDDVNLDKLVTKLTQQQRKKGRRISIVVWGWETLQARINENHEAKNAFDPGYSPALGVFQEQLNTITEKQKDQASGKQLAQIAARLDDASSTQQTKLPAAYADRELQREFRKALRRRGFPEAKWQEEISILAEKAVGGELSLASTNLRVDVVERAARSNATRETNGTAQRYRDFVRGLEPQRATPLLDALFIDAEGNTNKAIQQLRLQNTPDALGAALILIGREKDYDSAFKWLESEQISPSSLNPPGALNYLVKQIEKGATDHALGVINDLPNGFFSECPCLHYMKGNLIVASILPQDQKRTFFLAGLGINPRTLQLASDKASRSKIKNARHEYQIVLSQAEDLDLRRFAEVVAEINLWLELEDPATAEAAKLKLQEELSDPSKTLRRVRLALAYHVEFNKDALLRQLKARREISGWTLDESFAAFLMAFHEKDPAETASFFDEFGDELYKEEQLSQTIIAGIEVEALARAGRIEDSKRRLRECRRYLTEDQSKELQDVIEAIEAGDEIERTRKQYEQSGDLVLLRILVGEAARKRDHRQLAEYAPTLVRATRQANDFRLAIGGLYNERQYDRVIQLCEEMVDLYVLDNEFKSLKAWSYFHVGQILNARKLARDLYDQRGESNDRELAINTAIETGDWGYLQLIMSKELPKVDTLDAPTLIRLSKLALEVGSPAVDQFRDAAVRRFPTDPNVFLSAYTLGLERGIEDSDHATHQFFEKAVALSGEKGPIQSLSLKEVLNQTKGWSDHVSNVSSLLSENKIPIFVAAKGLRRQPADMVVGQALRNKVEKNPSGQVPILAFAGGRPKADLKEIKHIALDVTALFTLDYLGLLETTISLFQYVVIAPTTLSNLFLERQFLRVNQPSEARKATRFVELIASKKLKVLPELPPAEAKLRSEVGGDLGDMLGVAGRENAIVVRSGPVHKIGSLLDEVVDLKAFGSVLSDTLSVFRYLSENGKLDESLKQSAQTYLSQVDKGHGITGPSIKADSKLYLDSLSVTYFDHLGILEPLIEAVSGVFVPAEVETRARNTIKYSEFSSESLAAIERIRAEISKGLDDSRILPSRRRAKDGALESEEELSLFPTLDLLSDLSLFDFVVVDDRFLNKEQTWTHEGRTARTATTLDLLVILRASGKVSESEYWRAKHALREAGYCCVPVEKEELLRYVASASVNDEELVEPPELRAIRENISLPRRGDIYRAPDEPWLTSVRYSFVQAIRELWSTLPAPDELEARGDWLLHCLPKPFDWCTNPADQRLWAVATQQTIGQYGLAAFFFGGDLEQRVRYSKWVDEKLFRPLKASHPWLMKHVIDFAKQYVERLTEADDEKA